MDKIGYRLVRRKNMKRIRLRVNSDGVIVSAPPWVSRREIDAAVEKNREFIENALKKVNAQPGQTEGTVMLLGQKVRVELCAAGRTRLEDSVLYLRADGEHMKQYLDAYIERLAKKELTASLDRCMKLFEKKGLERPSLTVRRMTSRWGSCTPAKKSIRLNLYLVGARRELIDSVTIHELCHFYHADHSKDFYALYSSFLPDHRTLKKELDSLGLINK